MQYLIKDLSKLTGIEGARIRKWQERYKILHPQISSNGYWKYGTEDYLILMNIKKMLDGGEKISKIISLGREKLLQRQDNDVFSSDQKNYIKLISQNKFVELEKELDKQFKKRKFEDFIRYMQSIVVMVGNAWEAGMLSIADEHSFTKWVYGYIQGKTVIYRIDNPPTWLVTVFPGDPHELGALLFYSTLIFKKIPVKFVGALPLDHIVKELKQGKYNTVSFSLVLPQPPYMIEKIRSNILQRTPVKKVLFGGLGYENISGQRKI